MAKVIVINSDGTDCLKDILAGSGISIIEGNQEIIIDASDLLARIYELETKIILLEDKIYGNASKS